jgi:GTP-binding protein EngB required for normal cell division
VNRIKRQYLSDEAVVAVARVDDVLIGYAIGTVKKDDHEFQGEKLHVQLMGRSNVGNSTCCTS